MPGHHSLIALFFVGWVNLNAACLVVQVLLQLFELVHVVALRRVQWERRGHAAGYCDIFRNVPGNRLVATSVSLVEGVHVVEHCTHNLLGRLVLLLNEEAANPTEGFLSGLVESSLLYRLLNFHWSQIETRSDFADKGVDVFRVLVLFA